MYKIAEDNISYPLLFGHEEIRTPTLLALVPKTSVSTIPPHAHIQLSIFRLSAAPRVKRRRLHFQRRHLRDAVSVSNCRFAPGSARLAPHAHIQLSIFRLFAAPRVKRHHIPLNATATQA